MYRNVVCDKLSFIVSVPGDDFGDVEALEPLGHVGEEVKVLLRAVAHVARVART